MDSSRRHIIIMVMLPLNHYSFCETMSQAEVESRTQDSRPRTQKNPRPRPRTALPRTDPLEAKDRNARGQGHKRKCFPKKKVFQKFFQAISKKKKEKKTKVFKKFFQLFSNKDAF